MITRILTLHFIPTRNLGATVAYCPSFLHLKESLVEKWMDRLRSGSDEPLTVLLMAMPPMPTKATFVEYDSWQSQERSHPLRMLSSTLRALAPLRPLEWPCFLNLKIVYAGYDTDLTNPDDAFYPHSSNAKLSPKNGTFVSSTEICLANLSVWPTSSRWEGNEPNRLDPWLGDSRRVCEQASVKLHTDGRTAWIDGPSWNSYPCSFCRPSDTTLDSAPVILED